MTQGKSSPFCIPNWILPTISIITILITLGIHWGLVQAQLDRHDTQIISLEHKADSEAADRLDIETRLTRIETDLTYIRAMLERMSSNAIYQGDNP